MRKLHRIYEALQSRLRGQQSALRHAQKKHRTWRLRAEAAHDREVELREQMEKTNNATKRLELEAAKARTHRRWERRSRRSLYWKGRIGRQHKRINHLEDSIAKIQRAELKWKREHGVYWEGENKVRGGTPAQCKVAAANRARRNYLERRQPGYYSMSGGSRDYAHACHGYPYGRIWDCSTACDGWHYVAGIESPSGHEYRLEGFTGTELSESQHIPRGSERAGDLVVFLRYPGDGTGHHVEMLLHEAPVPGGWVTMGHGDSAIDHSVADAFGDGLYQFVRSDRPCPALN